MMIKCSRWDQRKRDNNSMMRPVTFACGVVLLCAATVLPAVAASAKDGEAVYSMKCKSCHAADGAGNPAIAKMMNVTFKPLGSAEVQAKSDADLKTTVTTGTGKMKPVAGLSPADVDNLVAYVRTLKK
jgi:mono/diheme cytochrome c family protein